MTARPARPARPARRPKAARARPRRSPPSLRPTAASSMTPVTACCEQMLALAPDNEKLAMDLLKCHVRAHNFDKCRMLALKQGCRWS